MKLFISADIEGTAGIAHWDEADRTHADWDAIRQLMTAEVVAACEGAMATGVDDIVIKDAHDSGRNLVLDRLPACSRIIRGWSGHPDGMMFGLDDSFDAAIVTGYHSRAGADSNPLAHTSSLSVARIIVNGTAMSEFALNTLCAGRYGVPVIFISGDEGICAEAESMVEGIITMPVLRGIGRATDAMAPIRAHECIREGVARAMAKRTTIAPVTPGNHFELEVQFANPTDAYRASWFPGVRADGERRVRFDTDDFFEVQRTLRFIID